MASLDEDCGGRAVMAAAAAETAGGSPPATCSPPTAESAPGPASPCGVSHWDGMAKFFDVFVSLTSHFSNLALDHVAEDIQRLIEKKGEDDTCHVPVIIDVAGGTGSCALEAVRRFPQARVLLTDISDAMLNVARKKVAEAAIANVEVKVMDGQDLQMADESVDALTCVFGIMFFPDRSRGWQEMQRVLRPGRKAAVVTWTTPGPHVLTDEAIAKYDAEVEEKEKKQGEEEGRKAQGMPRVDESEGEAGEGVASAAASAASAAASAASAASAAASAASAASAAAAANAVPVDGDTGKTNVIRSSLKKTAMADEARKQMLRLGLASAIAEDLVAADCNFSKVEFYPSPFVWKGITEGSMEMMSSMWKKMPAIEQLLAGRDVELMVAKLKEVMKGRLDSKGHVCVPCEALLTVVTK